GVAIAARADARSELDVLELDVQADELPLGGDGRASGVQRRFVARLRAAAVRDEPAGDGVDLQDHRYSSVSQESTARVSLHQRIGSVGVPLTLIHRASPAVAAFNAPKSSRL